MPMLSNTLNYVIFLLLLTHFPISTAGLLVPESKSQIYLKVISKSIDGVFHRTTNRRETLLRRGGKAVNLDDKIPSRKEKIRRRGMAAALFSTYFTVMGAKCALPSVLSQLLSPKIGLSFEGLALKPQTLMAQQLTLATFAVASGKLVLGPVIDRFGGVLSLQVSLSILMVMLGLISFAKHFVTFAAGWIVVDFVFSSCWAGCINAIHQSFPENEWAKGIGMIAAAARIGNASAFFIFAIVLRWCTKNPLFGKQPWRLVFGTSAILQVLPLTLLYIFGKMKPEIPEENESNKVKQGSHLSQKSTFSSSLSTLKKEASKPEFWLHLISRSALMVYGSFLLFVPTLMSYVYGLADSISAQVGSVFAIGCLLSISLLSSIYSNLSKKRKIILSTTLMGIAGTCAFTQLANAFGLLSLSVNLSILTMFLWGFSFAVPFYIPPSIFALARGGKESSATISDVFDFAGFGLLAVFNGYVASIEHSNPAAWIPTFQVLTGCSIVSLISLAFATVLE